MSKKYLKGNAMYSIIRIIITILICVLIIKLRKPKKKKSYFLIVVLAVCFCTALQCLPIENLFIDFQSPQQIINYVYPSNKDIVDIVYGENSCMVISEMSDGGYSYVYLKSENKSYKIPIINYCAEVCKYSEGYANFNISHMNNSSDYYLLGTYITNEDIKILSDSFSSDIKFLCTNEFNSKNNSKVYKTYFIYGIINNYDDNYSLQINNNCYNF